jgi:hypothetical protein
MHSIELLQVMKSLFQNPKDTLNVLPNGLKHCQPLTFWATWKAGLDWVYKTGPSMIASIAQSMKHVLGSIGLIDNLPRFRS